MKIQYTNGKFNNPSISHQHTRIIFFGRIADGIEEGLTKFFDFKSFRRYGTIRSKITTNLKTSPTL